MRNIKLFALLLCLPVMLFTSCSGDTDEISASSDAQSTSASSASCVEICDSAYQIETKASGITSHNVYSNEGTQLDEFMTSSYYGTLLESPDLTTYEGYAVFITDEPVVSEFGIFKSSDQALIDQAEEFCARRLEAIRKKYEGYKPELVAAAEGALCETYSGYVYYIATTESNEEIRNIIRGMIDGSHN